MKLAFILACISVMIGVAGQPPEDVYHLLARLMLLVPLTLIIYLLIEAWRIIVMDRGRR